MHIVGVRELKNRLNHYLSLTRQGMREKVIADHLKAWFKGRH